PQGGDRAGGRSDPDPARPPRELPAEAARQHRRRGAPRRAVCGDGDAAAVGPVVAARMAIDTPFGRLRAVLFDVDGTLYRALPLRAAIAAELLLLPFVRGPGAARRTWRVLRAYRGVHEELRALEAPRGDLADHHLRTAARRC